MTFTVSKTNLLSGLQSIWKMVPSKASLPILYNILFDIQKDTVFITAANDEGRITTSLDCVADAAYKVCIPAAMLLNALKTLPEQPLIFIVSEAKNEIVVKYAGGKFEMVGFSVEMFPEPKAIEEPVKFTTSCATLLYGLNQVQHLVAEDELRPVMATVYLSVKKGLLTFVASDGHVLGKLEKENDYDADTCAIMISKKIGSVLKAILPNNEDEPVLIVSGKSNASVTFGINTLIFRLVEGRYANYNSVIPKDNDKRLVVSTADLMSSVNRVSVFANKVSSLLVCDIQKDQLTVTACDLDMSTNAEEVIACEYVGLPMKVGVKSSYLMDIITHINSDRCIITLKQEYSAMLILPEVKHKGEELIYLMMPISINN
ncbi:MAG: DNA polymerase III subunit beta [Tannerellaceae bacterium]